ncbi:MULTISPECIES: glycerol-3-phosphate 1-O-acyltransferase PlsY [Shouchella]|uniref:Glycerol-3-phosphate acyltransferase n=2 Tax=Shouchella TaxID=2893057 RepID=A0ABY7W3N6_9BACI|nr:MULTISPECIES: glycerol-3-phosphate 1-O-acyltransferase PlsY [Shouchella]MED4127086.1 glycerol-3-phosphate 1-O-acyltransferase PlsY [Shouchella miscanthi]WDF03572.1 glycerol-3-phosphate 1-O-acyltransferase PlsY [Shouchella hunanensis]GAF24424.1 acyl-phosphate:glycerol-3-phosphate O-acyltransferase PlsY [Bacillus sp. JCM 19047]
MIITTIFFVLLSYLLGSVSFSYLIAKKIKKIDIRKEGSGNAGATNTLRVLGVGPAISVLLLDVLKGILPVVLAMLVTDAAFVHVLTGLAAILGHNWPIYFGFRGGKGVATSIGVLVSLVFLPALLAGVVAIASIFITRYVSLGSLLFAVLTPVALVLLMLIPGFSYPFEYILFTVVLAIMSLWRHRTNVSRLLSGTENKIGRKHA